MKKTWLFGTYQWQGNVKALFMYMYRRLSTEFDAFWIADNVEQASAIKDMGFPAIVANTNLADELFAKADVYVTENFRESYPQSLNQDAIILNLWHGVGLKHIELALGETSAVANSIVKKYVRNYQLYKNQVQFLTTSPAMESHFMNEMPLDEGQIIRGGYPRNFVYKSGELASFDHDVIDGKTLADYDKIVLFSPTYRFKDVNGSFKMLLPDLEKLQANLEAHNQLFIVKLHPFMLEDPEYVAAKAMSDAYPNIMFWDPKYDIYEIFNQIDCAIVDYSSIFYDLLESGVQQFIRYIPDYDEYVSDSELIADYFEYTDGDIVKTFDEMLESMNSKGSGAEKQKQLLDYFFKFDQGWSVEQLISDVAQKTTREVKLPKLLSFDIFDTLIRRDTLEPVSIFYHVQQQLIASAFVDEVDAYFKENFPKIRQQIEADLRDVFRKTTFERDTDQIEVTLHQIYERLQNDYGLSDELVDFLYTSETKDEIDAVQPIQSRIDFLFDQLDQGNSVYLVSDMYLEHDIIVKMLQRADERLAKLPLYLSSDIGYQKSTGKLFIHAFFDRPYHYQSWTHYGDNNNADGSVPRRFAIQTQNHDMDQFTTFEKQLIDDASSSLKLDSYKVSTLIQRYRWQALNATSMRFDETKYYAYAYIATVFVPYVDWAIRDAQKRGYKTLYFISRDGYYLKQIADALIARHQWSIKTKYIYGSRKLWRVPSFINQVDDASFTPFGLFSNIDTFDDVVSASQLSEDELLELLPELENFRNRKSLKGSAAVTIREIFQRSDKYQQRLVEIAAERRPLVKQYFQQEIDFDEKFAFVEFWGRGYTQDAHTRLMINAAGKEIDNPYYYIRNFTPDFGHSIRHRFTTKNANYSYFENVFATTPYKSIAEYTQDSDGRVTPVIESLPNAFSEDITAGIVRFAHDYAGLSLNDPIAVDRQLAETSSTYQFANENDRYIVNVFSKFKDNVGMYGQPREFAPAFTQADVEDVQELESPDAVAKSLRKISRNLGMSMAGSVSRVRRTLNELLDSQYKPKTHEMPINPLSRYVRTGKLPVHVMLLKDQFAYQNVDWSAGSKSQCELKAFDVLTVTNILWTKTGVPRLETPVGLITAHRDWVKVMSTTTDKFNYIYVKYNQLMFDAPILSAERRLKLAVEAGKVYPVRRFNAGLGHEQFLMIDQNYILFNPEDIVPIDAHHEQIKAYVGRRVLCTQACRIAHYDYRANSVVMASKLDSGTTMQITGLDLIDGQYYLVAEEAYVPVTDSLQLQIVTDEIEDFYTDYPEDQKVLVKTDCIVYSEPDVKNPSVEKTSLHRDSMQNVNKIQWDSNGMPWFVLDSGYVPALKSNFTFVPEAVSEISETLDEDALNFMAEIFSEGE